jgi:two-component system, NarL family, response regulator NreC
MDGRPELRVVVADSHPGMLVTAGLLLDAEDDLRVLGTATDIDRAAAMVARYAADVLIVDLHMLDGATRATISRLRKQLPNTQIVILTMEATPAYVGIVREAGALGYVLKEFADGDLAEAVREAARGHSFVSGRLTTS